MASKINIVGITAWVLVGLLLIGVGALAFMNQQQSGKVAGLRDALLKVGIAAGVEELSPETPPDTAKLPEVFQQVEAAVQETRMELASAKDALSAAQTEVSSAQAEWSQRMQEQTAKMDALTKELVGKDEAIATAKAEAEHAGKEAQEVRDAAEKQKADLEASIESLKVKLAEKSARLQAELKAAKEQASGGEIAQGEEQRPLAPAQEILVDALSEAVAPQDATKAPPGRVLGPSAMISLIRYSLSEKTMQLVFLDGQELTYREIPEEVYGQFIADGTKVDMFYRFKIQGTYKSLPPDSTVVRKYWKWQRRHKNQAFGDARVIEPEATPEPTAAPATAGE